MLAWNYYERNARRKYYAGQNGEGEHTFWVDGMTSRTADGKRAAWENCKPDPDAKSLFAWIKNTGVVPDYDGEIIAKIRDGSHRTSDVMSFAWSLGNSPVDIIKWAKL